jgi:tetratricopeptide (TPR) repeat protein
MIPTTDIEELKRRLKRGSFDDDLLKSARALWTKLLRVSDRDATYYKAAAMVSEVSYYFDDLALARKAVEEFQNFKVRSQSIGNRGLARERIRCYLAHIQATLYYDYDYAQAKDRIKECITFIERKLVSEDFRCAGTLAWANYQLGCCLRQLHKLEEAENIFIRSARHQCDRAKNKKALILKQYPPHKRLSPTQDEILFCNRRLAIVLGLGIAFCDYTRGRLSAALENLTVARTLLAYCDDPLNDAYLNLLFGSVMRCQAGSDPSQLEEAERIVIKARRDFRKLGHHRYAARATYELALIYLALADRSRCRTATFQQYVGRAKEGAAELLRISDPAKDARWISNALVLESRVERKLQHFPEAITLATKAHETGVNQNLCQIDALIARAESIILWVKSGDDSTTTTTIEDRSVLLEDARRDLDEALKLNTRLTAARSPESQNEKIESVCRLLLARVSVLVGNQKEAKRFFQQWKEIGSVEHQNIIDLALRIRAEIEALTSEFYVDSESNDLTCKSQYIGLMGFLIKTAQQKIPGNKVKQAKLLGIAPDTLRKWEAKLKQHSS